MTAHRKRCAACSGPHTAETTRVCVELLGETTPTETPRRGESLPHVWGELALLRTAAHRCGGDATVAVDRPAPAST